ncbi:MAG: 7TM domain-containing protein [Candidatus Paceibacterota bacterium]|jgi:hypothetical protein
MRLILFSVLFSACVPGIFLFYRPLLTITYAQTSDVSATGTEKTLASFLGDVGSAPNADLTLPKSNPSQKTLSVIYEKRYISSLSIFNLFGYWVYSAIELGIPANTIVLILLAPIIASLVLFVRMIVGLPSLDMFVPTALAYAFIAVGIGSGMLILASVVVATCTSRFILKRVPIMTLSKRALTHFALALFVFASLTFALSLGFVSVKELSIFPVLILMLLGDSVVSVQLRKTARETAIISSTTIGLGIIGYLLATSLFVRDTLLVWPEVVLLVIPIDFIVGRYFGLRLTEIFRFRTLENYGSE